MDKLKKEKIIRSVAANFDLEGMPLTDEDRERMRTCLTGKTTVDDAVKELVEKYTVKKV